MNIQKYFIILALYWLIVNNLLYENIEINQYLLKIWEEEFIFFNIIDSIVHGNSNQHKHESYTTDFCNSNFENNLDTAIVSINIKKDHINSHYIYSNINNK